MADEKVDRMIAAKLAAGMACYGRFMEAEEKEMMGCGKYTEPKPASAHFHLPRVLIVGR
jgi:hypothetical protein